MVLLIIVAGIIRMSIHSSLFKARLSSLGGEMKWDLI